MWFVTWQELNGDHKVSYGCDQEEAIVAQRVKQNYGKLKVYVMNSGRFQPKDALPE